MKIRVIAAVAAAGLAAACSSSGGGNGLRSVTVTSGNPTVQQIAQANGLTGVRVCPGSAPFVTSNGIGYRSGVKYGIDTFGTSRGRDSWLAEAKDLGFPATYQQGDTWVLYRAIDQSPGC